MATTAQAPERIMGQPVEEAEATGNSALDLAKLAQNDYGNGVRLIKRYGPDLLPVSRVGWHVWDGKRFNRELGEDEAVKRGHMTASDMELELDALRENKPTKPKVSRDEDQAAWTLYDAQMERWQAKCSGFAKFKNSSGNIGKIKAMLASAQPYLIKHPRYIDAQPWLLNCDNGTLDLRRSRDIGQEDDEADPRLRPCKREDLVTKLAPVPFNPSASCPEFMKFLRRIQPDEGVRQFLQVWFGYCLCGDTSEQKLVIMHGQGSNGKSTLIKALMQLMGDYAVTLDINSFLANDRRGGDATPDLARLPGARLVVASEPEPGARLNESTVKVITGGERMAVRQLFQEQFEFDPAFKVVISCNNRPVIRGQDHGIWRRIVVIPFSVILADHEKDLHFSDKLMAEASGILGWMLDGLAIYRQAGLVIPPAVQAAIDAYRAESDPVGQFLLAETEPAEKAVRVNASILYARYVEWCKDNAQEPVSQTAFGRRMSDRGHQSRQIGVRFYEGLRLLPSRSEEGVDVPL